MKEKEWIGINSLEQMKVSGNENVIVLLEDEGGRRRLAIPTFIRKWKLIGNVTNWKIIAYCVVRTINFCCFSTSYEHSAPELQGKGMAFVLWGWSYLASTCMQVSDFKDGHIYYHSLWPNVQPPDYLLGWSVLPDMYDFEIKED